jgi:hypothetical protein
MIQDLCPSSGMAIETETCTVREAELSTELHGYY